MAKQSFILKYAFAPALGWGILIVYFSLMPGKEVPGLLKNMQDAGLHFAIYAVFSVLLYFAFTSFQFQRLPNFITRVILLFGFTLGFVIELIQEYFIAGRTFEWGDVLANTAGCSLMFAMNFIAKKNNAHSSNI